MRIASTSATERVPSAEANGGPRQWVMSGFWRVSALLDCHARSELRPMQEKTCTENNANYFNVEIDPTPEAEKPDF